MDALWCPDCKEPAALLDDGRVVCTSDTCDYEGAPLP